jgi:hypothetical protein
MLRVAADFLLFWPNGRRVRRRGRHRRCPQDRLAGHIIRAQMLGRRQNTVCNTAQALAYDLQPAAQPA